LSGRDGGQRLPAPSTAPSSLPRLNLPSGASTVDWRGCAHDRAKLGATRARDGDGSGDRAGRCGLHPDGAGWVDDDDLTDVVDHDLVDHVVDHHVVHHHLDVDHHVHVDHHYVHDDHDVDDAAARRADRRPPRRGQQPHLRTHRGQRRALLG
jgi:hypothetical protein